MCRRVSIAEIRKHPWYTQPMRTVFADALAKLEAEQAETDRRVRAGAYKSWSRDRAITSMIKIAARVEFR